MSVGCQRKLHAERGVRLGEKPYVGSGAVKNGEQARFFHAVLLRFVALRCFLVMRGVSRSCGRETEVDADIRMMVLHLTG